MSEDIQQLLFSQHSDGTISS